MPFKNLSIFRAGLQSSCLSLVFIVKWGKQEEDQTNLTNLPTYTFECPYKLKAKLVKVQFLNDWY